MKAIWKFVEWLFRAGGCGQFFVPPIDPKPPATILWMGDKTAML